MGSRTFYLRARYFDDAGLFDEEMPSYLDYDLYLRALEHGSVRSLGEILCTKQEGAFGEDADRISDDVERKVKGQDRYSRNTAINFRIGSKRHFPSIEEDCICPMGRLIKVVAICGRPRKRDHSIRFTTTISSYHWVDNGHSRPPLISKGGPR